jgi:hypothetical protein
VVAASAPSVAVSAPVFHQLDRYVELELAGQDPEAVIPGLRAHLAGCPAYREEHASLRALVGGQP